jgi:hypothetical protein
VAKNEAPTIGAKLFVDMEKRKVLFAESDKEFVDVLFGFLTMPLGTIVRGQAVSDGVSRRGVEERGGSQHRLLPDQGLQGDGSETAQRGFQALLSAQDQRG